MQRFLGIYLHIPFCKQKCKYCDFCSFTRPKDFIDEYVQQLINRMERYSAQARGRCVDTLYFGGGTPSLLSVENVRALLDGIRNNFDLSPSCQISFECNPATADHEYFYALRQLGVNRLSIGMQSAIDNELEALGRIHTFSDFRRCYDHARRAGFDNISVDIMYGIPHQTMDSLKRTLDAAVELSCEHISTYGLTVEPGTEFYRIADSLDIADDDVQQQMYMYISQHLARHGYEKYEISNFCRKGMESLHNLKYWRAQEYLGLGVAAHSYFGGIRFGISRDIDSFMRGEDDFSEDEPISDTERQREYVMLGMRLTEGVSFDRFRQSFGKDFMSEYPDIVKYASAGYVNITDRGVSFTDSGLFVSNAILSDIL